MDLDLSASALIENEIYSAHSSTELRDMEEELYFDEVKFEAEKKWCIVEFDDGVQLVPLQWITNGNWCHFPNYKSTIRCEIAVKNYELSVSTWPTYAVKILGIYGSYEMAKINLKSSQDCHDEESAERVRRRKRHAQSIESDNNADCRRRRYSANTRTTSATPEVVETTPSIASGTLQNENLNIQKIGQLKDSVVHNSNEIKKIHEKLDEILEIIRNTASFYDIPSIRLNASVNTEFPLRTIEDLENLEDKLKDLQFCDELVQVLSSIGGTSGESEGVKTAYKLVDHLFSPELLTHFTWTGISKEKGIIKEAFQKFTHVLNAFQKVITLADSRYTMEKNVLFFRDKILKHSRKRTFRKKIIDIKQTKGESILVCNLDSGMGLEQHDTHFLQLDHSS